MLRKSDVTPPGTPRLLLSAALAIILLVGVLGGPLPALAGDSQLPLDQGFTTTQRIGPKRTTSRAQVAVTIPSSPLDFGIQFRGTTSGSGYRAQVSIDLAGVVVGSFTRVISGREIALQTARQLPLKAQPGEIVHVEATATAKKAVKLYLRVWKYGTSKPKKWQVSGTDASTKRFSRPGYTYFWARAREPEKMGLAYRTISVEAYSATKAKSLGVSMGSGTAASMSDSFSIAVIPDTQRESGDWGPGRFTHRTEWVASNAQAYRLKYALHTGDVTNWGWLEPKQLASAQRAMSVLTGAGIPYSLAIGNHDTRAVGWDGKANSTGYGGSAYMYNPECHTRLGSSQCDSKRLVRDTSEISDAFPLARFSNIAGVFESGKIDNSWSTLTVNRTHWLFLSLELWPRMQVVDWAERIVASHPDHNVVILTHSYLTSSARIYTKNGGYGETSPTYLYDRLVKKYSNIKLIFSGHTGKFASRTDRIGRNVVVSYLGNELSSTGDNPVRVVTINPITGAVTTTIYNPLKRSVAGTSSNVIRISR